MNLSNISLKFILLAGPVSALFHVKISSFVISPSEWYLKDIADINSYCCCADSVGDDHIIYKDFDRVAFYKTSFKYAVGATKSGVDCN